MGMRLEQQEPTQDNCVFTLKQNEIKQKIICDLIRTLFDNIPDDDTFDVISTLNLFASVLVCFNAGVITHAIQSFGMEGISKDFMKSLFDEIYKEVDAMIKKGMM